MKRTYSSVLKTLVAVLVFFLGANSAHAVLTLTAAGGDELHNRDVQVGL